VYKAYWWVTGGLAAGLLLAALASYFGWGLSPEAKAGAQVASVRVGSSHPRGLGGGFRFGK
jgi:hypothetical protein